MRGNIFLKSSLVILSVLGNDLILNFSSNFVEMPVRIQLSISVFTTMIFLSTVEHPLIGKLLRIVAQGCSSRSQNSK